MKDLLDLILKNITTHPEEAVITESSEGDMTVYTITVHPEDMGRVIGKDGKVIRAIRSLAHVIAIRKNQRYRITLNDSAPSSSETIVTVEEKPEETEDLIAGAIDISEPQTSAETGESDTKTK